MKPPGDNLLNLFSGIVVLVIGVALVAWLGAGLLTGQKEPIRGRMFVAYFDDAGGIEPGDAVRIKGRRAGVVREVGLVEEDGQVLVRVAFEINPGTGSPWLRRAAIPADSKIEVTVPRMFRRPQLAVTIGSDEENLVPEGGEWTNTKGRTSQGELEPIVAGAVQFKEIVTQLHDFLDSPLGMARIERMMTEARAALRDADTRTAALLERGGEAAALLDNAMQQLDRLKTDLERGQQSLNEQLEIAASGGLQAESAMLEAQSSLTGMLQAVTRFESATMESSKQFERAGLGKLGIELRKQAARLRASMEIAEGDPSRFGDMPVWRRSRKFFSGDHPLPGGDPSRERGD